MDGKGRSRTRTEVPDVPGKFGYRRVTDSIMTTIDARLWTISQWLLTLDVGSIRHKLEGGRKVT